MKNWKILPILALINGCSWFGSEKMKAVDPIKVVTVEKKAPTYHPPFPEPISTMPVEWSVLTPQTMAEYLDAYELGEARTNAFYGLTPKGYENLSHNIAEIKRYLRQVISIVDYYRNLDKRGEEDGDQLPGGTIRGLQQAETDSGP
jgi:hypothetical protein